MSEDFNSKNYTIVTACRNRLFNLKEVIKSWADEDPFEIIIIDWGSDQNIKYEDFDDSIRSLLKIYRNESDKWILTWAFNSGLSKVKTRFTVKLDCDHLIKKGFLKKNQCVSKSFRKASWRFTSEDQAHINGAFISCSELLKNIGFFNERITTYGWDDSDIYKRLFDHSLRFELIDAEYIEHINQSEETRTSNQKVSLETLLSNRLDCKLTHFLIRRNENLVKLYDYDWGKITYLNGYEKKEIIDNHPKHLLFKEISNLQTFILLKKEHFYKKFGKAINIEDTTKEYFQILYSYSPNEFVPINLLIPDLIDRYKIAQFEDDVTLKNIIKFSLYYLFNSANSVDKNLLNLQDFKSPNLQRNKKNSPNTKRKLIVKPMHGLGNRLRVIASAYNIAKYSGRDLVICWDKDEHFNAEFFDLFENNDLTFDLTFTNSSLLNNLHDLRSYQYMENELYSHKGVEINTDTDLDILVISSSVLQSKFTDWGKENKFLSGLKLSNDVLNITKGINITDNHIGIHIRYDGDNWEDLAAEQMSNWNNEAHQVLKKYRNTSKPQNFIEKMQLLIKEKNNLRFFISAANKSSIEYMLKKFPGKIDFINSPSLINSRDSLSLKYALADMILLSSCNYLLGSGWSSFTEAARRFSKQKQKIEIVGEHF